MAITPPSGVRARFSGGWAYLTVPSQPGMSVEVEYSVHDAPFHPCAKNGAEHLLPMYQAGTNIRTKWRARYKRGDQASEWTTGEVWAPDGFTENAHENIPDGKPQTPTGLQVVSQDVAHGAVLVSWFTDDVPLWLVQLEGGDVVTTDKPEFEFVGLTPGKTYSWSVRAVARDSTGAEVESDPASATFTVDKKPGPDPDPNPVPGGKPGVPQNVRAHCITHESTKVEWDRDPAVLEYEVWIGGNRDAAQRTKDTIVTVTGLLPNTQYTAHVVAHINDQQSEPGSCSFKTGVPEPPPIVDPDTDTAADWPAPGLQVWPLEGGKVRASWTDPDDGTKPKTLMGYPFWHVSIDQQTWFFTKERQYEFELAPGTEVMVSVYGVWDNTLTAIATKGVAL